MDAVKTIIWIVMILTALAMIVLILMQHGKGADAGAAFGSGSAQGVFGASGSANFLTRLTAVLTALFFVTSLTLAVYAKKQTTDAYSLKAISSAPAVPVKPAETSPTAPKTAE